MMTLSQFNKLPEQKAIAHLLKCCASSKWAAGVAGARPFSDANALINTAADIWYRQCDSSDWKEAFTGHPQIGNLSSLKKRFANSADWAAGEQSTVAAADETTLRSLAEANAAYYKKFGYIFIVSASGKSAKQMLAIIRARLEHDIDDEIQVAMGEQHKITAIRLVKLMTGLGAQADMGSHITTHVLDTSTGRPGSGMKIALKEYKKDAWRPVAVGVTNIDGRISDLLPPGRKLKPAIYLLVFHTADYYTGRDQLGFYPEVSIRFSVTDESHYHIPLLISPFGYTTYRGS